MVTAAIITLGAVGIVALLCFKGITIKYDKQFTINDKRGQRTLTPAELKSLEAGLNAKEPKPKNPELDDEHQPQGPMDAVIAEIQDLFGPANPDNK